MPTTIPCARTFVAMTALVAWTLAPATGGADTSDVTHTTPIVIEKQGDHCADDPNCFNRYHPQIEAVAEVSPGDILVFHTRDALDTDLTLESTSEDLAALDLNLVHPMTGPVHIEGAERGDVVEVTLMDIEPDQYGYTVIVPGFGFLRDQFTEPFLANWRQDRLAAVSDQIPGVRIPFDGFLGSVGVLPGEPEIEAWLEREAELESVGGVALQPEPMGAHPADICGPEGTHAEECLRTIPPRENGGNMDIQQMQVGTTMLFPCFVDGCGLFVGDVHYAQGDGEVSGTAIETGAVATVRVEIREGAAEHVRQPQYLGGDQLKDLAPNSFHATTGIPVKPEGEVPVQHAYLNGERIAELDNLSEDLVLAARNALNDAVDWMVREKGLTREQAYVVASVAVDLRIGQVVDVPNYTVSAIIPLDIFEDGNES